MPLRHPACRGGLTSFSQYSQRHRTRPITLTDHFHFLLSRFRPVLKPASTSSFNRELPDLMSKRSTEILDIKGTTPCGCSYEHQHEATHGAWLNHLSYPHWARERPRESLLSTDSHERRTAAICPAGKSHRDALRWSSQRKHHSGRI